jgi:hypothetical protein
VVNTGTMDQWAPVRAHAAVYEGRGFFAVRVEALPQSQNTWRVRRFICVFPCVQCFMTMSRDWWGRFVSQFSSALFPTLVQMTVGWTPPLFNVNGEQKWIGAQKSYGFIAGTGGKVGPASMGKYAVCNVSLILFVLSLLSLYMYCACFCSMVVHKWHGILTFLIVALLSFC